ncbi:MAG: cytochrome C [Deltaproteobacteria bacterium]|nr:cytochrome C [Deltaproteobacteria bacterium]
MMTLWSILLATLPVGTSTATASRCELCHDSTSWSNVRFDHSKTSFPLEGAHAGARCEGCHDSGVDVPISSACTSCHVDVHRRTLGRRCEGCHDTETFEPRFDARTHRRTGFELTGGHAALPCEDCHVDALGARTYARARAECVSCHLDEYQRAAQTSLDHVEYGFDERCATCHLATRFSDASFPAHDTCFLVSAGPHARIQCRDCHSSVPRGSAELGACRTQTAACTSCHAHSCDRSERKHREVPGYQCKDRKCYECHQFTAD